MTKDIRNIKIKDITIQGYKSIPLNHPLHLEIEDVTIFLGANGAGKSNIISFFKLLGAMAKESLQMYIAQNGSNQTFLYYGAKITPQLTATIYFETEDIDIKYNFCLSFAVPNKLILSSESVETLNKNGEKIDLFEIKNDFYESGLGKYDNRICQELKALLEKSKVYQFGDSSQVSPVRQAAPVESAHYLLSDAGNLASFLYYLKNNYRFYYNRIVSYTESIMPQFKDFYLEPDRGYISLKWIDKSANDYVFSPAQLSDGTIRYIALATLLLQPKETMPSLIIIDEPELGLHPFAIDQLAYMIKEASLNAQVIIATQSPTLIDNFDLDDITVIERDDDNQYTIANKMDKNRFSEWLKEYSVSELWAKNVIGGRP